MNKLKIILCLVLFSVSHVTVHAQSGSKFVKYAQADIVLQNARIVDMVKGIVLEGQSLHLSGGKITGIGPVN